MKKLYWRLKSWYYLKRYNVILGKIADVAIFEQKATTPQQLAGSGKSLVEHYREQRH